MEKEPSRDLGREQETNRETEQFTPASLAEACKDIFPEDYLEALREEVVFEEALGLAATMAEELGISQESLDKVLGEKGILELEPTPEEKRRLTIERNRQELARRKEAGEIEKTD